MKMMGIAVLAAAAGTALGQAHIDLSIKLSTDMVHWSDTELRLPGTVIHVGIWMQATPDVYGLGGATMRLTGTGLGFDDHVAFRAGTDTGRVGPFNFGAATNMIFRDAPGTFRIDAASDAANANSNAGLTFFQRDPATASPGTFWTQNPALCFLFDLTLGSDFVGETRLELDQLARGLAVYFTAQNASRPTQTADVTLHGARIVVPGPGAAGVLGVGLLARRRRRG